MMIITDTASDITLNEALEMNIKLVNLKTQFNEELFIQESLDDFNHFFELLIQSKELPKTSQPAPNDYLTYYNEAKEKQEDVIVICLSSGLSGTINAARIAKEMCEYENIHIIDSKQAITTQRFLVQKAVEMRNQNKSTEEIINTINNYKERLCVCGMLDTLTYLKKGGRIPAALALLGNTLHIKPIIELKDTKLSMISNARGRKSAFKSLWKEFEAYDIDENEPVYFGYTYNKELGIQFMEETVNKYNLKNYKLYPVGSIIGTHVGPGCIALSFCKKNS